LTSHAPGAHIRIVDSQVITTIVSTGGAVIVGLGGMWITAQQLGKRMDDLKDGLTKRIDDIAARVSALEAKVDHRFDLLMEKFYELDNRVSRIEDHLKIPPK
jgi:predicted RNA-binding protein with PIN domain